MPEFLITSPDGTQYRVTAPPGATEQDALNRVRQQHGALPGGQVSPGGTQTPPASPSASADAALASGRSITDQATRGDLRQPWERMLNAPPRTEPTFAENLSRGRLSPPGQGVMEQEDAREKEAGPGKLPGGIGPVAQGFMAAPEIGALAGKVPKLKLPQGATTRAVEGLREEGVTHARGVAEGEEGAARKAEADARSWLEIEQNRQRVLSDLREKARVLQKSHQEAGENVVQAQGHVALAERKVRDADAGVTQLEQQLLARPTMSAEDFSGMVRQTTQEIHDKYSKIRRDESGFDRALDSAGDAPRVNTAQAQALIDHHLKDVKNPSLQRVLTGLRDLLEQKDGPKEFLDTATMQPRLAQNEGAGHFAAPPPPRLTPLPRLSVRAAESLRGYLDSVIRSKQFGDLKIDRETAYIVRQVKKALVESATSAWQPYRQALAKWRTLSRPLDIVERNGALRKVLDTDPVSTDYALTEAQVVGHVLRGAKAGNPTLARLIKENPQIKDAARLHFTQDLFIKEKVPSEAELRTWLKNNERALKQTGLYGEFRDIRVARETANKAVAQAKGGIEQSRAQLKAAQQAERGAAEQLATGERLRQKQQGRIADAQKAAKDRAAEAEGKTVLSSRRVAPESAETKKSVATKRRQAADKYRQYETEITAARPENVPTVTRSFLKNMREDGHLTDAQYSSALEKIKGVEDKVASRDLRAKRIKTIAKYAALAAVTGYGAYYGVRGVSSLLP